MPEKNCLGLKNERKQIPLPCDKKGCLICNDKKNLSEIIPFYGIWEESSIGRT